MAQPAGQPWNSSSRTQIQAVQLPKLVDARTQIRLLCFQNGHDADTIACDYTVHNLSDPPEYIAISYTWGNPTPTHTIHVANKSVLVHENCYTALWQARQSYPASPGKRYFWLDAVCIDQSDLEEKSLQVQAMSLIFGNAARVAVSLGANGDMQRGSHLLSELDRDAKDMVSADPKPVIDATLNDQSHQKRHEAAINLMYSQLDINEKEQIIDHYISIASQSYWSRLWIIQELSVACKIDILFSSTKYEWDWLDAFKLESRLGSEQGTPLSIAMPDVVGAQTHSHASAGSTLPWVSLTATLKVFRLLLCSDPRDRIYAVLSIMEQPKGLQPLRVDYGKSALQLAMDCICHFSHVGLDSEPIWVEQIGRVTSYLFEALHVTDEDFRRKACAQLWHRSRPGKKRLGQGRRIGDIQGSELVDPPSLVSAVAGCEGKEYFFLDLDDQGGGESNFTLREARFHRSTFINGRWPLLDQSLDLRRDDFIRIFIQNETIAIASPNTQHGDILVPIPTEPWTGVRLNERHYNESHLGLIMRKDEDGNHANTFRIIGQAFVHPSISPYHGTDWRPVCNYCVGSKEPTLGMLYLVFGVCEWTLLMSRFLFMSTPSEQLDPATASSYNLSYGIVQDSMSPEGKDGVGSDAEKRDRSRVSEQVQKLFPRTESRDGHEARRSERDAYTNLRRESMVFPLDIL